MRRPSQLDTFDLCTALLNFSSLAVSPSVTSHDLEVQLACVSILRLLDQDSDPLGFESGVCSDEVMIQCDILFSC